MNSFDDPPQRHPKEGTTIRFSRFERLAVIEEEEMIHEGFEKPHQIEPLPLWKYQGLAKDIENAKKEITAHVNAELSRFRKEMLEMSETHIINKMFADQESNEKSPRKASKRKA